MRKSRADGGAERARLAASPDVEAGPWREWGPYLSERTWGTVREDYSEGGTAWEYFPHDHARSRAYRWNEDGLAGVCDLRQRLCLALTLWNGRDPILKERIFGLTGHEGNHGEDAKEYWWYLDSTPTHSWMRWRYHYPQDGFPYEELIEENRRRDRSDPEYELLDTGVFDEDRYWIVVVDYAKAGPEDLCMRVRVTNAGPVAETLHVLPTLWFRNTWSWGLDDRRPRLWSDRAVGVTAEHPDLGRFVLDAGPGPDGAAPEVLYCENETNTERLFGVPNRMPWPKDGIGDHVVHGLATVNPDATGTKAAVWYRLGVDPAETVELRLRLRRPPRGGRRPVALGDGFARVMTDREQEADEFYAQLAPPGVSAEEAMVMRQAFAGMLWSKQFYHYDVDRWLQGDPAGPQPPERRRSGRNGGWRHLNNFDVISMPDKWEYPWYAAWDLAFHCVVLAHVDPGFAKHQLTLLCREWFMHPNGQLPAYEWAFDDVNPPVHAWAALRVFELDGSHDFEFLERIFHKLLLNFTWWVNRKDSEGNNVFQGGFLGLDNIGPFDRTAGVPDAHLEQSDGTAWMAMYCLNLLDAALRLAGHDGSYEDVATKFFEHFGYIASAMNNLGMWDEEDGFYYDVLHCPDNRRVPLRVRSMVGLVPLFAVAVLAGGAMQGLPGFTTRMRWFERHKPEYAKVIEHCDTGDCAGNRLMSILSPERLRLVLSRMLDEEEFLSPHGLRALSRIHRHHPLEVQVAGAPARVGYEPGESTEGLFGGNSNWRGPVWFPLNYLVIESLRRFHEYLGDDYTVELPTGSGNKATLAEVADELTRRLVAIFLDDADGHRPVFGWSGRFQTDPAWHNLLLFYEYFHGDTAAGLGASHQTGWTGLVADLITGRHRQP
jgi:hypothetical protein